MSYTLPKTRVIAGRRGHVRAVGDRKIGGYLIYWSTPATKDSYDTYFPPDVDLMQDVYNFLPPVYYEHAGAVGLPTRKAYVGDVVSMSKDDKGLWVEAVLHDGQYADRLYNDVKKGRLFWSSGTAEHLLDIAPDGRVLTWPIFDATLTENPATPFGTDVVTLRQHYAAKGITTAVRAIDTQWSGLPQSDERQTPDELNLSMEAYPMADKLKLNVPPKAYFQFMRSLMESPAPKHADIAYALSAIRAYGADATDEKRMDVTMDENVDERADEMVIADEVVDAERMARGLEGAAQILADTFGIELVEAQQVMQRIASALALEGYIANEPMMATTDVIDDDMRMEDEEAVREEVGAVAPVTDNERGRRNQSWREQGNKTSRLTAKPARFDNGQRRAPDVMKRSGIIDSLAYLIMLRNDSNHDKIQAHNRAVRAHYAAKQAQERAKYGELMPIRAQSINPSTAGGFLVSPEFATQVIEFRYDAAKIAPLTNRISTTAYEYYIPKQSNESRAFHIGENTTIPTSQVGFSQVRLRARKLATIIESSNELFSDAFVNVDELLARNIAEDFAEMIDRMILWGSGINEEPLGIYNTPDVSITTDTTIEYADLLAMRQRLMEAKTRRADKWQWAINPLAETNLRQLQDPNGNYIFVGNNPAYVQAAQGNMSESLLGGLVHTTNQASNPDSTTEGVIFYGLWDSVYYLENQALEIAFSNEAGDLWAKDQNAVRAIMRYDVAMAYPTDIQVFDGLS